MKPGDRVVIVGKHPWHTHAGTLVAWEIFGLGWTGWRVALDGQHNGECYASPEDLRDLRAIEVEVTKKFGRGAAFRRR